MVPKTTKTTSRGLFLRWPAVMVVVFLLLLLPVVVFGSTEPSSSLPATTERQLCIDEIQELYRTTRVEDMPKWKELEEERAVEWKQSNDYWEGKLYEFVREHMAPQLERQSSSSSSGARSRWTRDQLHLSCEENHPEIGKLKSEILEILVVRERQRYYLNLKEELLQEKELFLHNLTESFRAEAMDSPPPKTPGFEQFYSPESSEGMGGTSSTLLHKIDQSNDRLAKVEGVLLNYDGRLQVTGHSIVTRCGSMAVPLGVKVAIGLLLTIFITAMILIAFLI